MWLRVVVLLLGVAYVGYRLQLAVELRRAKRTGDLARAERLRGRPYLILRWVVGIAVVLLLLFTYLITRNSS